MFRFSPKVKKDIEHGKGIISLSLSFLLEKEYAEDSGCRILVDLTNSGVVINIYRASVYIYQRTL